MGRRQVGGSCLRGPGAFSQADVATGAGDDLLSVAEVPEQVLPAAGDEGRISLDGADLIVRRLRSAFEPGGDRPSAPLIQALPLKENIR